MVRSIIIQRLDFPGSWLTMPSAAPPKVRTSGTSTTTSLSTVSESHVTPSVTYICVILKHEQDCATRICARFYIAVVHKLCTVNQLVTTNSADSNERSSWFYDL